MTTLLDWLVAGWLVELLTEGAPLALAPGLEVVPSPADVVPPVPLDGVPPPVDDVPPAADVGTGPPRAAIVYPGTKPVPFCT
jgi:hypothetical protein